MRAISARWCCGDDSPPENWHAAFPEWKDLDTYEAWCYQFRLNQSYPAFSHCSINNDPGSGDSTSGDLHGGFNRYLRWDTATILDTLSRWEMTVSLDSLCPEQSATVDLTPRRLQQFRHHPGDAVTWRNLQLPAGTAIDQGNATVDASGLITIRGARITREANRIVLVNTTTAVEPEASRAKADFRILDISPNPVSRAGGSAVIAYELPEAGRTLCTMSDALGRTRATLADSEQESGQHRLRVDARVIVVH